MATCHHWGTTPAACVPPGGKSSTTVTFLGGIISRHARMPYLLQRNRTRLPSFALCVTHRQYWRWRRVMSQTGWQAGGVAVLVFKLQRSISVISFLTRHGLSLTRGAVLLPCCPFSLVVTSLPHDAYWPELRPQCGWSPRPLVLPCINHSSALNPPPWARLTNGRCHMGRELLLTSSSQVEAPDRAGAPD